MLRGFLTALFLVVLALPGSAFAGKPDLVTPAANVAKKDFAVAMKAAQTAFNNGTAAVTRDLARGATTRAGAATTYRSVILTYVQSVAKASHEASLAVEAAANAAMTAEADDRLVGAVAGDGGTLDTFGDYVQTQLEKARAYAIVRVRKVTAAINKGSPRPKMNVVIPSWPFVHRAVPTLGVAPLPLGPSTDSIVMLVGISTRLEDGSVIVAFAGTAPKSSDGNFGIYLVGQADVRAIGKLSDGGIPVTDDHTWSLTATLYTPNVGNPVNPGNRIVTYGVDPFDAGPPAGRQPNRFMSGGVIGIE
jgi:hypothetical protein